MNVYLPWALAAVITLSGCETMKTMDVSKLTDVGGSAMKAMSLSDGDITAMSDQSCAAMDQKNQVAPASSKYTSRLNQVVRAMPSTVNGKTANYRVYLTPDVNAWAMANGCIRV
ncbi:MAG: peptidase, partial [Pseudomonas sp.]